MVFTRAIRIQLPLSAPRGNCSRISHPESYINMIDIYPQWTAISTLRVTRLLCIPVYLQDSESPCRRLPASDFRWTDGKKKSLIIILAIINIQSALRLDCQSDSGNTGIAVTRAGCRRQRTGFLPPTHCHVNHQKYPGLFPCPTKLYYSTVHGGDGVISGSYYRDIFWVDLYRVIGRLAI